MDISKTDDRTAVITVSGDCAGEDVDELRQALVAAVDGTDPATDLVVDARAVTSFDDACLPALVAARSRAKWNRQSLAVLSEVGAPVEAGLRRSGHLTRIAVYPDLDAARDVLDHRRAGRGGRPRAVERGEHDLGIANPFRRVVR